MIKLTISLLLIAITTSTLLHSLDPHQPNAINPNFTNCSLSRTSSAHMQLLTKDKLINLLSVPDVMQATDYTCGPSSLSAVLSYYGVVQRESELARWAKTTEQYGTEPSKLAKAAVMAGVNAVVVENMTIGKLQEVVSDGKPVIVLFQAWKDDDHTTPYSDDWQDGHYAVVIGYDDKYLYFQDPWLLGSIAYILKDNFIGRWHDQLFLQFRRVYHLAIILQHGRENVEPVIELE